MVKSIKINSFEYIAHWQLKKDMPKIYQKNAIRIHTNLGSGWGIRHSVYPDDYYLLKWGDIPECYRRYELKPRVY